MSAKSTKSILIMCALFSLLLSTLACMTSASNADSVSIKNFEITMDASHLEEFRAQLRKFADKHSLKVDEAFYNKDHTYFSVFMDTDDFHINVSNNEDSPGEIGASFFNDASPPISKTTVTELFDDLRSFINEIPNVMIVERMLRLKVVGIEEDQRKQVSTEILAQLKKIADKHSLEYKETSYNTHAEIRGDGFRMTFEVSHKVQGVISVIFYIDFDNNVAPLITPTPYETLDEIVDDIKSFLSEIPNVTVTETP